jgi:hypothetical protein
MSDKKSPAAAGLFALEWLEISVFLSKSPHQTAAVTTISTFHFGLASAACTRAPAYGRARPISPDQIHRGKIGQVGEIDLRVQHARLVAAARTQCVDGLKRSRRPSSATSFRKWRWNG